MTSNNLNQDTLKVQVNGEPKEYVVGVSLADVVADMALTGKRFAVERNQEIVPKSSLAETALAHDDIIEIVQAIGGG